MPVNFDLNIIKGSTFSARVIATNADGSPVDLTHYLTRGYVKQRYSDTGVILNLAPIPTPGFQSSGYIDILISSTGTSVLPVTQAVYDIEMYGPNGGEDFVLKLLDGRVNIHPEVTNPQSQLIQYIPYTGEASIGGSGTTPPPYATTTTTTTSSPSGGGGSGSQGTTTTTSAPYASISITQPIVGMTSVLPFDLVVSMSSAHHWHWIDSETSSTGFNSHSAGTDITGIGTMVSAGTTTTSITANDLPGGENWGPAGYLYVVAVDENHQILAKNSNGDIATDSVLIGIA